MRFLVEIWKPPTTIDYGPVDLDNVSVGKISKNLFFWSRADLGSAGSKRPGYCPSAVIRS